MQPELPCDVFLDVYPKRFFFLPHHRSSRAGADRTSELTGLRSLGRNVSTKSEGSNSSKRLCFQPRSSLRSDSVFSSCCLHFISAIIQHRATNECATPELLIANLAFLPSVQIQRPILELRSSFPPTDDGSDVINVRCGYLRRGLKVPIGGRKRQHQRPPHRGA